MGQLSYAINFTERLPGLVYDASGSPKNIVSLNNPSDVIPYGVALVKVSGNDNGVKLPVSSGDFFKGISVRDAGIREGDTYPLKSAVAVMRQGAIAVLCEEAVTGDDDAYVRFRSLPHTLTLTFSGNLITANVVNGSLNGEAISPITFAASNAATVQAVANAIAALSTVASATVTNTDEITIVGNTAGLTLTGSFVVTLGVSQATATLATVSGPSDGTQLGAFRTDDGDTGAGPEAVLLTDSEYIQSGSASLAAVLQINLP